MNSIFILSVVCSAQAHATINSIKNLSFVYSTSFTERAEFLFCLQYDKIVLSKHFCQTIKKTHTHIFTHVINLFGKIQKPKVQESKRKIRTEQNIMEFLKYTHYLNKK